MKFDDHLEKLKTLLQDTLKFLYQDYEHLLVQLQLKERIEELIKMTEDIVILDHKEAIKLCKEYEIYKDEETKTFFGERDDIPEAQERKLIDKIDKIVFLVRFPLEFKSFYMQKDPEDLTRVLGCDVEVPTVGEIIGSGVRCTDEKELVERLKSQDLKVSEYQEYIDMRKYGAGHTSGMGLGVDRFLTWIMQKKSIKEVVTFPRYPGHLFP